MHVNNGTWLNTSLRVRSQVLLWPVALDRAGLSFSQVLHQNVEEIWQNARDDARNERAIVHGHTNDGWDTEVITAVITTNTVLVTNDVTRTAHVDTQATHPEWHVHGIAHRGTNGTWAAEQTVHAVLAAVVVGGLGQVGAGVV